MSHVADALLPRPTSLRHNYERFNALSSQLVATPGSSDESSVSKGEYAALVVDFAESHATALRQFFREFVINLWLSELTNEVRVTSTRRAAVVRYLLRHPRLMPALGTIVRTLRQRVDEAVLSVNQDPEIDDEYLTLEIRQNDYDDRILDLLASLQEEVVRQIETHRAPGWILVTTYFRPPETRVAL
jgi:hypothetical protein